MLPRTVQANSDGKGDSGVQGPGSKKIKEPVVYQVKVVSPPPKNLGLHQLPHNTQCGETVEVEQQVCCQIVLSWHATSHERIEKPSPSRTLICDIMSCWEHYLCCILSITPCDHLVRRTHAPQHHAEHRAWRKATALPWKQASSLSAVVNYGKIDKKTNRPIQTSLPGSKDPHWSCFSILPLPTLPNRNRNGGIRDTVKGPTLRVPSTNTIGVTE